MKKLQPASIPRVTAESLKAKFKGKKEFDSMTDKGWQEQADKLNSDRVFMNDTYQVNVSDAPEGMTHISIKRIDKQPCKSWRDFQEIKNQVVGPEREALELYPAESRRVDSANQYHLWVLPEGMRVPCGWNTRLVMDGSGNIESDGSCQQPFEKDDGNGKE